jgi:tetratricopeptide (TPR) repeat protein
LFLSFEQYASAENCFRAVVREFPDCVEGWTNLGDALLMQYCDKLDTNDLRSLGIGQPAVGAFYQRPGSLEAAARGVDRTLWQEAVEALQKAAQLQPDRLLAEADLGLAFLMAPSGQDAERAVRHLRRAVSRAASDAAVDPLMRAAVRVNAGAAELANGDAGRAAQQLAEADKILREAGNFPDAPVTLGVFGALLYNEGLLLAAAPDASRRRDAVNVFESYLRLAPPASTWWPLAYERYTDLCRALKLSPKAKDALAKRERPGFRVLTSVKVTSGATVTLGEPVREATARLGKGVAVPLTAGKQLMRWCYPEHGVDLLAADRVLAICLKGSSAPALPLQKMGAGSPVREVHPGLTKAELEQILAGEPYDIRQIDRPDVGYRFYPGLGLGARLKGDRIEEFVIAQVPRKPTEPPTGAGRKESGK